MKYYYLISRIATAEHKKNEVLKRTRKKAMPTENQKKIVSSYKLELGEII